MSAKVGDPRRHLVTNVLSRFIVGSSRAMPYKELLKTNLVIKTKSVS